MDQRPMGGPVPAALELYQELFCRGRKHVHARSLREIERVFAGVGMAPEAWAISGVGGTAWLCWTVVRAACGRLFC